MKLLKSKTTPKSIFTRKCITEAILYLLKDTSYEKLRVSSIVKKAGVSRMTFYKYYGSPYEALTDYLKIMIDEYLSFHKSELRPESFFRYKHIVFSLKFFDQYNDYFLTLVKNNLHGILLNGINEFLTDRIVTNHPLSTYKILTYSGGLLNVFLSWEVSGKQDSAEDIAHAICDFYNFSKDV